VLVEGGCQDERCVLLLLQCPAVAAPASELPQA
jgi:hypothetical protein